MKKIKRVLAVLLALILALGAVASLAETLPAAVPLTLDDLDRLNGGSARVMTRDGRERISGFCLSCTHRVHARAQHTVH